MQVSTRVLSTMVGVFTFACSALPILKATFVPATMGQEIALQARTTTKTLIK